MKTPRASKAEIMRCEPDQKIRRDFKASGMVITERPGRETTADLIANSAKLFSRGNKVTRRSNLAVDVVEEKEQQPVYRRKAVVPRAPRNTTSTVDQANLEKK